MHLVITQGIAFVLPVSYLWLLRMYSAVKTISGLIGHQLYIKAPMGQLTDFFFSFGWMQLNHWICKRTGGYASFFSNSSQIRSPASQFLSSPPLTISLPSLSWSLRVPFRALLVTLFKITRFVFRNTWTLEKARTHLKLHRCF